MLIFINRYIFYIKNIDLLFFNFKNTKIESNININFFKAKKKEKIEWNRMKYTQRKR